MTPATSSVVPFTQPGVEFIPGLHCYAFYGEPVVNVTAVLRAHKISADWSTVDPWVLQQKRQVGQAVHAASHYLDEGDLAPDSVSSAVQPYLDAWELFKREFELEILLVETRLVHPLKRYGGTVDRFCICHTLQRPEWGHLRPSVVDIKTGDPEDAGAGPQTAAYEEAIRAVLDPVLLRRPDLEAGWLDPWVRYSVQLLDTGTYRLHAYASVRDSHRFNWALSLEATAHPSWRV